MDIWKFYDITHREHSFCNPMSRGSFDQLIDLLRLPAGARVVDIASGKGEFLIRLAERYEISGIGIDISSYFIADSEREREQRVPEADITFKEMNGKDFVPDTPESFDLAACIGADWIFGGHRKTIEALKRMTVPGGWIIAGAPYWLQTPPAEYLKVTDCKADMCGTHVGNVSAGEELGLRLAYTLVSKPGDWDRYEGLQWYAAGEFARSNPDDADVPELIERVDREKIAYLKWGRDTINWAVYAFRRPLD